MARMPEQIEMTEKELALLWQRYKAQDDQDARNLLIERYLSLVRYTAQRLFDRLPNVVELDDLIQDGLFGLMDALKSFDQSRGIKFETYCTTRIYGSILDRIRELDWVPRLVRSNASKLERARQELEMELGRNPTDDEISAKLGLDMEGYDKFCRETSAVSVFSYSAEVSSNAEENKAIRTIDSLEDKRGSDPVRELQKKELKEFIVRGLKKKEKLILLLYYYEEMTMKEIGLTLDMSESRVCQIHSRLVTRLKMQLAGRKGELSEDDEVRLRLPSRSFRYRILNARMRWGVPCHSIFPQVAATWVASSSINLSSAILSLRRIANSKTTLSRPSVCNMRKIPRWVRRMRPLPCRTKTTVAARAGRGEESMERKRKIRKISPRRNVAAPTVRADWLM